MNFQGSINQIIGTAASLKKETTVGNENPQDALSSSIPSIQASLNQRPGTTQVQLGSAARMKLMSNITGITPFRAPMSNQTDIGSVLNNTQGIINNQHSQRQQFANRVDTMKKKWSRVVPERK